MRLIKIIFVTIFILLVVIAVGGYLFLRTFDVNQYKGQIVTTISQQLGRSVSIDRLGLNFSFAQGLFLEIQGLSIADNPQFATEPFIQLKTTNLNVDLNAFLTSREIKVTKILIDSPRIHIIRDSAGKINAQTIGVVASSGSDNTWVSTQTPAEAAKSNPTPNLNQNSAELPKLRVQSIQLVGAEVSFEDKSQTPPLKLTVQKIEAEVTDFSLTESFSIKAQLALFSNPANIFIKGKARLDLGKTEVSISNLEMNTDLSTLSVKSLVEAIPALSAAGIKDSLQGKLTLNVPILSAGAAGLGTMNMNGKLQDARVQLVSLPAAIEKMNADFSMDSKDFYVPAFSLSILNGGLNGSAKIEDYLGKQTLNVIVKADELPLEGVVGNLPDGMKITGHVKAQATVKGESLAKPEDFIKSLEGNGNFEVKDGKIENQNLLKLVLKRVDFIPGLSDLLTAGIPEKYREDYMKEVTIFQQMGGAFKLSQGVLDIPNLNAVTNLFEANIKIKADMKMQGSVSGDLSLPEEFSGYLIKQAPPFEYLKNGQGQVVIPLTSYEGDLVKMKIYPNIKNLAMKAAEGEASKQINKLLNKALGGTEETSAPTEGSPAQEGTKILNNVLDKIKVFGN